MDKGTDRAEHLLGQIRQKLLEILKDAPSYGTCALELTLHDGDVTFIAESTKAYHKIKR